ncbi:spore germination protein GerW family protein [Streptomyces phaeochromogenes]|uniref:spore germination protein GerW family protein n=1 Tax=Streptomyces phaeochromogenes TaxID=1923 RepID=UPI00386E129D|nr:spore germination protein GerW family protein [Streptomyces phaeochromogenes]WTA05864.1 spore germination protein GerW family protein [Streptomyces phaeochromogenes]
MPNDEPVQPVEPVEPVKPVETASAQPPGSVPADVPADVLGDVLADVPKGNPAVVLLERLAEKLGGRASVSAVYGEPVTRDGVTVIPVAKVGFGFGAGVGREAGAAKTGEGGGGGGGVGAKPIGFIEIQEGFATYRPIRDPWVDVFVPLAVVALGSALPGIIGALRRRK